MSGISKALKLAQFVEEVFGIKADYKTFRRTYAGHWQRSQGAWSWSMQRTDMPSDLGSQWSLSEILSKKDYVVVYEDGDLIVEDSKHALNEHFKK